VTDSDKRAYCDRCGECFVGESAIRSYLHDGLCLRCSDAPRVFSIKVITHGVDSWVTEWTGSEHERKGYRYKRGAENAAARLATTGRGGFSEFEIWETISGVKVSGITTGGTWWGRD